MKTKPQTQLHQTRIPHNPTVQHYRPTMEPDPWLQIDRDSYGPDLFVSSPTCNNPARIFAALSSVDERLVVAHPTPPSVSLLHTAFCKVWSSPHLFPL